MILTGLRHIIMLVTVLFLVVLGNGALAQDAFKRRQVLDSKTLSSSGLVRLGDLFKELPLWNSFSSDGFTHFANNSFSGVDYSRQTWYLFVDGRVLDPGLLGFNDLNTLPFTTNDLDSIEIFHQASMIEGIWAGNGAIHLHTKKSSGVQISSELYLGNEVNDPGPFIYTELEPVNIDRIGPDFSTSIRLGSGDFYSNIHLSFKEHHATDRQISYRTRALHDLNNRAPRKILQSTALRMGYQTRQALVEWGVNASVYDDFPYLLTYGAEIPMTEHHTSIYVRGRYALRSGFAGFVNITRNEDHLKNRFNYLYWDPAIKGSVLRIRTGLEIKEGKGTYQIGLGEDYYAARVWTGTLNNPDYSGRHLFISAQQGLGAHFFSIQSSLNNIEGSVLPKIAFHWSLFDTELNISYNKQSKLEQAPIWYWMDEGYNDFERLGPNIDGFQDISPSEFYSAMLSQGFKLGSSTKGRLLLGLRSQRNDWSIIKDYQYVSGMTRFLGDLDLQTKITGTRRFAGINVHQKIGDLSHELSYVHMLGQYKSDKSYESITNQQPRSSLLYSLHYDVSPGFRFGSLINVHSATRWDMFQSLDPRLTPKYEGITIPAQVQWDLFAKKTFFNQRLWSSMRLENILDRALQEWPIGEIQQMTFHIGLGIQIGNEGK